MTHSILALLCVSLAFAQSGAPAGTVVKITSSTGGKEFDVREGEEQRSVAEGGTFYLGQTLLTPPGTSAVLSLNDGSSVVLGPGTEITVEKLAGKQDSSRTIVDFTIGVARMIVRKLVPGKQDFNVSTGAATMGIRGTEFLVEHDGENGTTVHSFDGKVLLARDADSLVNETDTVALSGGFMSSMKDGMKAPAPAKEFNRAALIARLDKLAPGFGKMLAGASTSEGDGAAESVDFGVKKPAPAKPAPVKKK
jgi:hypothetical protein